MTQSYERISILAGGFSAGKYNVHNLPGTVIGVNDAIVYGRCDICVSMDRLWFEGRWTHMVRNPLPTWTRMATLKQKYMWPTPSWMTIVECDYKSSNMSDNPNVLNGTNSGLFALNLAYQFKPTCIELYGMDGSIGPKGQGHWYKDYSWHKKNTSIGKLQEWGKDLQSAIKQCNKAGIEVRMMK